MSTAAATTAACNPFRNPERKRSPDLTRTLRLQASLVGRSTDRSVAVALPVGRRAAPGWLSDWLLHCRHSVRVCERICEPQLHTNGLVHVDSLLCGVLTSSAFSRCTERHRRWLLDNPVVFDSLLPLDLRSSRLQKKRL